MRERKKDSERQRQREREGKGDKKQAREQDMLYATAGWRTVLIKCTGLFTYSSNIV